MNRRTLGLSLFASIIIFLLLILLSFHIFNNAPKLDPMVFKITMNDRKIVLLVDRNKPVLEASRQLKIDLGLSYQKYSLILSADSTRLNQLKTFVTQNIEPMTEIKVTLNDGPFVNGDEEYGTIFGFFRQKNYTDT